MKNKQGILILLSVLATAGILAYVFWDELKALFAKADPAPAPVNTGGGGNPAPQPDPQPQGRTLYAKYDGVFIIRRDGSMFRQNILKDGYVGTLDGSYDNSYYKMSTPSTETGSLLVAKVSVYISTP